MKPQKPIQVTSDGKPSTEALSESEAKIFYAALFTRILEQYRLQRLKDEQPKTP